MILHASQTRYEMAALMKESTPVDPKMFTNASRERRRRQNEMGLYPGFASPSPSITVEGKPTNWIRSDRYLRSVHIAPHQRRIQKESQP